MKKLNKKQLARIILIIIVLVSVICFMYIPAFKSKLTQVLMLFRSMSVESIIGYIKSFGAWAILISFLLMLFQSVIAPLPAFWPIWETHDSYLSVVTLHFFWFYQLCCWVDSDQTDSFFGRYWIRTIASYDSLFLCRK